MSVGKFVCHSISNAAQMLHVFLFALMFIFVRTPYIHFPFVAMFTMAASDIKQHHIRKSLHLEARDLPIIQTCVCKSEHIIIYLDRTKFRLLALFLSPSSKPVSIHLVNAFQFKWDKHRFHSVRINFILFIQHLISYAKT